MTAMQVQMLDNGLKITDKFKWSSSEKFFDFDADVGFDWLNEGLANISKNSWTTYMGEVVKQFRKNYDKMMKDFTKTVQGELLKLEKAIKKMASDFEKQMKKKRVTEQEAKKAADAMTAKRTTELARIKKEAEAAFRSAVEPSLTKAHDAACKKIQEGATLKKKKAKMVWTVVKFVLVATAIVLAVVATVASAGAGAAVAVTVLAAIGIAFKAISLVASTVKDVVAFAKQYRSNVNIAATELANAEKALNSALKALEMADKNHEAMMLKTGEIKRKWSDAKAKLDKDNTGEKAVANARKKLDEGLTEVTVFERKLGATPKEAIASVNRAKAELVKANPKKWNDLDTANKLADCAKNITDACAQAAKVVDALT